jgi:hypothetical protein
MAWRELVDANYRFSLRLLRIVSAIVIVVALVCALGATLDATMGSAYYNFHDALSCLAVAALAFTVRLVAPWWYRICYEALK